jgi:hypothetical protein
MRKRQVGKQQRKGKVVSYIMGFLAFMTDDNVRDCSYFTSAYKERANPIFQGEEIMSYTRHLHGRNSVTIKRVQHVCLK